jgi:hypothetical protein
MRHRPPSEKSPTFAGRQLFSAAALARAGEPMRIYGLDFDSLPAAHADERG